MKNTVGMELIDTMLDHDEKLEQEIISWKEAG
jgi:hypothetical protein